VSKELQFLVYCIEEYKEQKGLTGREVMDIFTSHRVLEYIMQSFELLHINGPKYIVQDIDEYISG
jgi:hypothetical protein